ncbi:MAG TPA: hypothetical protein VGK19_17015 [Capsulimonadaceae bacterium]|jgi:hypothetical protein
MDLRLPIGGLFSIFGVILTVYGLFGPKDIYAQSLGINVNLIWGLVMLLFGGVMAGLAFRASVAEKAAKGKG